MAQLGIDQAENNATIIFRLEAAWAVYDVAYDNEEFTTDDVWVLLTERGYDARERRALGAVMLRAVKRCICKRTDRWFQSERPEAHANPKPVYASLVVAEQPRRVR